jgi:Predicted enzyme related to lactoylglutathione lyase
MKLKLNSLYICVKDMKRAIAFYEAFLGQKADTADEVFSVFDIGGFRYCLFQPDRVNETVRWGDSCLPSFETDDVESTLRRVTEPGPPNCFPAETDRREYGVRVHGHGRKRHRGFQPGLKQEQRKLLT